MFAKVKRSWKTAIQTGFLRFWLVRFLLSAKQDASEFIGTCNIGGCRSAVCTNSRGRCGNWKWGKVSFFFFFSSLRLRLGRNAALYAAVMPCCILWNANCKFNLFRTNASVPAALHISCAYFYSINNCFLGYVFALYPTLISPLSQFPHLTHTTHHTSLYVGLLTRSLV